MKKILIILTVMLGMTAGCACARNNNYANMDVNDFTKLLQDEKVQLVDVRTPEEFSDGHIAGAMNIDIYNEDFMKIAEKELDKSRPVAVYCRSGKRSAEAARELSAKGYKVTNLIGGFLAWKTVEDE